MRDAHSAELTGRERGGKAVLDAFGLLGRRAGRIVAPRGENARPFFFR